jgi:hypothetical protein
VIADIISFMIMSTLIAQGVDLGASLTLGDGRSVKDVYKTPGDLVNLIVPNMFVLGGVIILGMTILAGIKYMSNTSKGAQEAYEIFKNAVIGFVVMFAAYWIVQIIKIVTGADIPI